MSILAECQVGAGKHALVVDDEEIVGEIIARVLEQMGYVVDHVLNGEEALERARQKSYDTVVCDILMPGVNGMALYETWANEAPDLSRKMVFVTGDSLGLDTSAFVARTGCPCIYKPFRLAQLAEVVRELETA